MDELMTFDDIYDAIRHTVQRCGGAKAVASVLFPDKAPDAAARYLLDSLNISRPEKLDIQQIMVIVRIGHEHNCHSIMHFLADHTGYSHPRPISTEEQRAALERDYIQAVKDLRSMFDRHNSLREVS